MPDHHHHNYGQSCGDESHAHDHSHDPPPGTSASGELQSLYSKIDLDNVVALNAKNGETSGQNVIKPWDDREDETKYCESDADDALIISIPFTAQIKLRTITIKSGPGDLTPSKVQLFTNDPSLDFSDAGDRKAVEILNIVPQREGVEYAVRPSKFSNIRSLQLYFPNNISEGENAETSRVYYVGLKGESSELTKNPEGIILYEANANPSDHKVKGVGELQGQGMGM